MDEKHTEVLGELQSQSLCNDQVAVVHKGEAGQAGRLGDLLELSLANDHPRLQAGRVGNIEQVRAHGIAIFRDVIVPVHTVVCGTVAGQHRGMRDQGNARADGLGGQRIGAGLHEIHQVWHRRQGDQIGAQTVDRQDQNAAYLRNRCKSESRDRRLGRCSCESLSWRGSPGRNLHGWGRRSRCNERWKDQELAGNNREQ